MVTVAMPHTESELPVSILEWVDGRTVGNEKSIRDFEELGRMTAVLDQHA